MSITILYIAAAMAAGLLFNRFAKLISLPNVTGYLVAGLLIGPSVLNLIPKDGTEALNVLVTLALGFIAYSIGGEFNINNIKAIGGKSIIITMFQALTAVGLVDITLCALGFDVPLALTLGAIAAATAPAATLMVVRQYRANGPVTRTLLPVVAMDDAVGLIVFAVSLALAQGMSGGGDMSFYTMVVQPLTEIVLSLAIGGAIGLIASIALRFFHSKDNFLCVSVAAVLLGTLYENDFFIGQLGIFGNLDLPVGVINTTAGAMLLLGAVLGESRGPQTGLLRRAGAPMWCVVYLAGCMAAMYITYTPVGMIRVIGLQARYFLPVFLLAFWALAEAIGLKVRNAAQNQNIALAVFAAYGALSGLLVFQHTFIGPVYTIG